MDKFRERIKDSIEKSPLTQKEIAKRLHISEGNITNWKTGKNTPSIDILYQLCKILEESADYLLGLDTQEDSAEEKKTK